MGRLLRELGEESFLCRPDGNGVVDATSTENFDAVDDIDRDRGVAVVRLATD